MKVKLANDYRKHYTLDDLDRAKMVIAYEKEDEMSIKDWAEYAINEVLRHTSGYCAEVLKAEAYTSKNCRVWNAYGDDTEDMDVIIKAIGKTNEGFIEVTAYLSDIWQTGAIEYKQHMFYQIYKRIERY